MTNVTFISCCDDGEQQWSVWSPRPVLISRTATREKGASTVLEQRLCRLDRMTSPTGHGFFGKWEIFGWLLYVEKELVRKMHTRVKSSPLKIFVFLIPPVHVVERRIM